LNNHEKTQPAIHWDNRLGYVFLTTFKSGQVVKKLKQSLLVFYAYPMYEVFIHQWIWQRPSLSHSFSKYLLCSPYAFSRAAVAALFIMLNNLPSNHITVSLDEIIYLVEA